MPLKRARFLTYDDDSQTLQAKKYIEDAGIVLDIRDIAKDPLTEEEVARLVAYYDIRHFLNPFSASYTKHNMDENLPDRDEMIKLIAEDHTLLRRPIISSGRLLTVGCHQQCIADMLQINSNGHLSETPPRRNSGRSRAAMSSHK